MHLKDRRGLEVSTRNTRTLDRYETALELTASYFVDPLAEINAAIADDPTSATAHCLRAGLAVMATERGALPLIDESASMIESPGPEPTTVSVAMPRRRAPGSRRLRARRAALRRHRHRLSARPAGRAAGARRRLLPRPVDDAARPHRAGVAALGRERARLRLRARHARVRPRGDGALRACRGHRPARRSSSTGATRGPCTPWRTCMEMQGRLRDGIEWLTRAATDWSIDNGFAYPQLVAPRAASTSTWPSTSACSSSTTRASDRCRTRSRSRCSTRRRCCGACALRGVDVGAALAAARGHVGADRERGLLRLQRRARRDGLRRQPAVVDGSTR